MKITENFSLEEFQSKDGSDMPAEVAVNVTLLAIELQKIRDYFGRQITINSGYRSPEHNKSVGGSPNSQHLLGRAADIVVEGLEPEVVFEQLDRMMNSGEIRQGGLGLYPTFVHYDIRGIKSRW